MPLLDLVIYLVAIALLVIVIRKFLPENSQPIKTILVWTLAAIAIWIVLAAFGVIDALKGVRTPRL